MRNNVAEYRTVRPADAKVEIKHLISKQRPVMIWGPPGIGKSEIVDEIGIETTRNVIDLRLLLNKSLLLLRLSNLKKIFESLIFKCSNLHESLSLHQILTVPIEELIISMMNESHELLESQSKLTDDTF